MLAMRKTPILDGEITAMIDSKPVWIAAYELAEGNRYCTCCERGLTGGAARMLELDQRDNTYHDFCDVPEDRSQGWFPFGLTCARKKIKEAKAKRYARRRQRAMTTLLELAERCEKATGPDRDLDVAIVYALHPDIGPYRPHCSGEEPRFWHDPYYKQPCPKFTGMASAATALLPDHLYWMMAKGRNTPGEPLYAIQIIDPETRATVALSESDSLEGCICAAALRARNCLVAEGERQP